MKTGLKRAIKIIASVCLILSIALISYACASMRTLEREIENAQRNPDTGVIVGAEAITLNPDLPSTPTTACLLIHGFCGARSDLADLGERLHEKGYTVRLMRLPGHGTTPRDFAQKTKQDHVSKVTNEYKALKENHKRVFVVGFSMGGTLATLFAAKHPVDRLVLLAPYYRVSYKWYYILPAEFWNATFRHIVPYVTKMKGFVRLNDRTHIDKIFSYRAVPTSGAHQLIQLGRQARKASTLEQITCPVLLIHSEGDEAADPKAAKRAFEKIAAEHKQAVWLERSNHLILWDYDREEVKRRIVEFLSSK